MRLIYDVYMSNVYFIGDLHFGHKSILKFRHINDSITTVDEHDEFLIDNWNNRVTKRDTVFVMGDVAFSNKHIEKIGRLNGNKVLVKGNHDKFDIYKYLKYFNKVVGICSYKSKFWLSHAPIHPVELRGRMNIHGHVHANSIDDYRYFNVSAENIDYTPIAFEEILNHYNLS